MTINPVNSSIILINVEFSSINTSHLGVFIWKFSSIDVVVLSVVGRTRLIIILLEVVIFLSVTVGSTSKDSVVISNSKFFQSLFKLPGVALILSSGMLRWNPVIKEISRQVSGITSSVEKSD